MVGNTGRKCSSQGINVIGGGAQCMGNIYKALLSPKSRKFDLRIQLNVPEPTLEHNMWGLVLYRQSAILERETGIELSRATLDGWVMRVGELLRPISVAMAQELVAGNYIQADETTVGVQMHDG